MLSDSSFLHMMKTGCLAIAPFNMNSPDNRLTPAGFNFSFSKLIVSLKNQELYELKQGECGTIYFELLPGDTALALTSESIWVSKNLAGTFHSKVSYVSKGLGHISTTLDPGWKGQLLISINSPHNGSDIMQVPIAKMGEDRKLNYFSFITLCLFELKCPAENSSDNNDSRLSIISEVLKGNPDKNSVGYNQAKNLIDKMILKLSSDKDILPSSDGFEYISDEKRNLFVEQHNEIIEMMEEIKIINMKNE